MNRVYQPENSKLCGQACVAMILKMTLKESVAEFGYRHVTHAHDVIDVLRKYGFSTGNRCVRLSGDLRGTKLKDVEFWSWAFPKRCMLRIGCRGMAGSHWVLLWDGKTYDPAHNAVDGEFVTSYLEIGGYDGDRSGQENT